MQPRFFVLYDKANAYYFMQFLISYFAVLFVLL